MDLGPGVYSLTLMLEGFTQVKREGIELIGSATLTIPVAMSVGNLAETIIVTGASSGIGLATAQLFVEQGARVAILGRDEKTLSAAAAIATHPLPVTCAVST